MKRTKWFREAKLGIFVHWGIYSLLARGEWVMFTERIPGDEYAQLARRFNPKMFDAQEWVSIAKEAGMKYMILTTRHHDGFCLFDSKVSDFTSVKTAAGRDFIAEYVKACRQAKLKVGLYYSLGDWRFGFPKVSDSREGARAMVEQAHTQVRELMSQYGKIDILWYDGGWVYPSRPDDGSEEQIKFWQAKKLNSMVRKLQPHILINNRSGLPEDFDTPEQHSTPSGPGRIWETCMTMNDSWGYSAGDHTWKSSTQLVHELTGVVSKGGNYLLNIGPKADGRLPAVSVRRLKEMGKWMNGNGESIYGAESYPHGYKSSVGPVTAKGNRIFIHAWHYPGREMCFAGIKNKVIAAHLLANGKKLDISQTDERLFIRSLPDRPGNPHATVIVLTLKMRESGKFRPQYR